MKSHKLKDAAVKIGRAVGKADRKAHQVAQAGAVARKELRELGKQIAALKKQLEKSGQRLKRALQ